MDNGRIYSTEGIPYPKTEELNISSLTLFNYSVSSNFRVVGVVVSLPQNR